MLVKHPEYAIFYLLDWSTGQLVGRVPPGEDEEYNDWTTLDLWVVADNYLIGIDTPFNGTSNYGVGSTCEQDTTCLTVIRLDCNLNHDMDKCIPVLVLEIYSNHHEEFLQLVKQMANLFWEDELRWDRPDYIHTDLDLMYNWPSNMLIIESYINSPEKVEGLLRISIPMDTIKEMVSNSAFSRLDNSSSELDPEMKDHPNTRRLQLSK
ncbi:uncharacterized protein L201_004007 [Kwoniella dendrophila CBS 6074]|uniref:Restriction endonuclease domain-containing protein n=1 Tax=Kwoniella dendrophila CBS 6074 TaxID=1295534 RepID=A0AAX4JW43_9TREE